MNEKEIEEKVINIVASVFRKKPSEINKSTDFVKDLHAKSIDIIALLAALEGEFNIHIPSSEVRENNTVGKAIEYMKKRLIQE